jgi:predicted phosphodiesterase
VASPLTVGVVSDTHGLVRPEAVEALRGSDVLWLDLGGVAILVLHDRALLGLDPVEEGLRVVVFGHSHRPLSERHGGVLWFNPGSAGPRRFRLPVSVGRLVFVEGRVRPRLITLEP